MGLWSMKSVLPRDLETKRVAIAKRHNRLVGALVLSLFAFAIIALALFLVGPRRPIRTGTFIAGGTIVFGLEAVGIWRILKYDEQMCVETGFMCPLCGKPLYEARNFALLRGECPKCHKSVLE